MTGEVARLESRNQQILRHAIEAFGSYGVRGASLRDIARRAGVSLTLIHHHYGNKPSLVWASTDSMLKAGTASLARLQQDLLEAASPNQLVAAWMRYLDEAFGADSKRAHLRLIHRLRGDPDVEPAMQTSLDSAEPLVRAGLRRLFPCAHEESVDLVLQSCRAALTTLLLETGSATGGRKWRTHLEEPARRLIGRFVTAAITAALTDDNAAEGQLGHEGQVNG